MIDSYPNYIQAAAILTLYWNTTTVKEWHMYTGTLTQKEQEDITSCIGFMQSWLLLSGWRTNIQADSRNDLHIIDLLHEYAPGYLWSGPVFHDIENINVMRSKYIPTTKNACNIYL